MIDKLTRLARPSSEREIALSIVTIALNASKDLPLTIESIAGQTFQNFEYIIVDGYSWDDSAKVYKRYQDVIDNILWVEDSGVYAAMNHAAQNCRGEYVIYMNAVDAFYSAEVLQNIFDALGTDSPDVVHGDHVYVDKGLEYLKRSCDFAVTRRALWEGKLTHKWHDRFPCHQATFTKTSLLRRLGGYRSGIEICADHDFLLRAADAGATMRYVDETVAHYFGGGMSAQRGERLGIEWIQAYRSRSRTPELVDRFFSAHHLVQHDTQAAQSGGKVSGFFRNEGPAPESGRDYRFCWCAGDGFSVVSPRHMTTLGLVLQGTNTIEDQKLLVSVGGQAVETIDLSVGDFKIAVAFPDPLPPQTIVELFPTKGTIIGHERRYVSVILRGFYFQPLSDLEIEPLTLETTYKFSEDNRTVVEPILRTGWSGLEPEHVWSLGRFSHLLLAADARPREIRLKLRGNPYVDTVERTVDLLLNGKALGPALELSDSEQDYTLVIEGWTDGKANILTFQPAKTAQPPSDPRELGVCLLELTLL